MIFSGLLQNMAPQVTSWDEVARMSEKTDRETGGFWYTMFAVLDDDDDAVYYGQLTIPQVDITLEQLTAALSPLPDEILYPGWPTCDVQLTQAPENLPADIYIKRPDVEMYSVFRDHNVLHLISAQLLQEAKTMQFLSQHTHPNIIRFHGCRVRRGHITGLIFNRHPYDLNDHLKNNIGPVLKEPFMEALGSAVNHLHSLGWAHNDLNPTNIMVNANGMPVLIDFGSAMPVGEKLGTSRGNEKWIEGSMADYDTSETSHDAFALEKIREWLEEMTLNR
ncbi:kinase-like domain-containing protein [Pseudomassariella vexata]|uniref:Kinase-like domain-containing protein n=1 Tax=Pseudomassariella vexata TaxID=1141098 RepID=A0A1Y2DHA2_9PEZI|nr:kinase-like domain-containing protein [Pseudomassariella vexata]ORY58484.1 kinase-like domain-containing protein [Pseudomassariella vexata]